MTSMRPHETFLLRDFVETAEGLIFALVECGVEDDRVLGFLRYLRQDGGLRKLGTEEANAHLRKLHPEYLFYSEPRDAVVHGVPVVKIARHYRARERLKEIMEEKRLDPVGSDARRLCGLFLREGLDLDHLGVTGSLLIGAQNLCSDIDLVIYVRDHFRQARHILRTLQERGDIAPLDEAGWRETYRRRGCALGFEEYRWHELRKFNKGVVNGRKFDIGPAELEKRPDPRRFRKAGGIIQIRATVTDDRHGFDHPARYGIDHAEIPEALSFTPTYAGQARSGERVEISGLVEQAEEGGRRLVVGSSREAPGEYIRVLRDAVP